MLGLLPLFTEGVEGCPLVRAWMGRRGGLEDCPFTESGGEWRAVCRLHHTANNSAMSCRSPQAGGTEEWAVTTVLNLVSAN